MTSYCNFKVELVHQEGNNTLYCASKEYKNNNNILCQYVRGYHMKRGIVIYSRYQNV